MPETFLPLTHLTLCSTLSMGWNLTPISSCHPEWSLTVTVKPPWGNWVQAAAEAKKKKKKMQCMAIHRSGLLLGGMQGGSCRAPCAMSYPDLVFSTTAEFAGLQSRGSFLWLLHGYIVPIWLRCQPATRDQPSCYCDRSVIFCFLFFSSSLICLIQGNHCKCTVPSPDPTEVSDTAPVDLSGTRT